MRAAFVILLLLAGCGEPTPGEVATAELGQQMRAQSELVRRGVELRTVFESCTDDCSGHRAGYLWALDHPDPLTVESECANQSASFEAGCRIGMRAAAFE